MGADGRIENPMNLTPGPWTWRYDRLTAADEAVVVLDTNEQGYDGMFGGTPPNEADARLIAAAPMMYAYVTRRAETGDEEATQILEDLRGVR